MTAKVFVGNLVFSTTSEELKAAFEGSANVLSANIITRGRRSLGYGFVEFATEAEAEKAVAALNKKEIAGRPINVEVARPRDPAKEEEAREKKAARPPKAPRVKKEGDSPTQGADGASPSAAPTTGGRRRGGRGGRGGANASASNAASSSAPGAEGSSSPNGAAATGGSPTGTRGRRPAGPRRAAAPKRAAETRPESDTTLFVANVPFSTDDAQLLSFFAKHNPKSAHVVRMRNGRSRGYGFVEFADAAGQQAGLAVDGQEVPLPNSNNKTGTAPSVIKLSVKVAMTPPVIPADAATPETAATSETAQ